MVALVRIFAHSTRVQHSTVAFLEKGPHVTEQLMSRKEMRVQAIPTEQLRVYRRPSGNHPLVAMSDKCREHPRQSASSRRPGNQTFKSTLTPRAPPAKVGPSNLTNGT